MEQKYYICKHCGNIVLKAKDSGVPVVCCGEPMTELIAGTSDGAREKHVPVWSVENGIVHVQVGSVEHPMLPEHSPSLRSRAISIRNCIRARSRSQTSHSVRATRWRRSTPTVTSTASGRLNEIAAETPS